MLIYTLNAGVPSQQIQQYAEENIVKELARIKGVGNIGFSGATPFYVEVCFDPDKLDNFGISIDELHNGISAGLERQDIVGNIVQEDRQGEVNEITVMLGSGGSRVRAVPRAAKSSSRWTFLIARCRRSMSLCRLFQDFAQHDHRRQHDGSANQTGGRGPCGAFRPG